MPMCVVSVNATRDPRVHPALAPLPWKTAQGEQCTVCTRHIRPADFGNTESAAYHRFQLVAVRFPHRHTFIKQKIAFL